MKDPSGVRQCKECSYFMPFEIPSVNPGGECRKNPPNDEGKWPQVEQDDYCGGFSNTLK